VIGTIGQTRKSDTPYEIRSTESEIGTIGQPRQSDRVCLRLQAALYAQRPNSLRAEQTVNVGENLH